MQELEEQGVSCPYCGERITVLVEPEAEGSSYIEDCQVCCQPIVFSVGAGAGGEMLLELRREDD